MIVDEHVAYIEPQSVPADSKNIKGSHKSQYSTNYKTGSTMQNKQRKFSRETLVVGEKKAHIRGKSYHTTTTEEEDRDLEVDEQVAYATSSLKPSSTTKSKSNPSTQPKKRIKRKQESKKYDNSMAKKVPNFFGLDPTDETLSEEEIESAYTELARKLFIQQLEGKASSKDIYNHMTNDFKLRSVIEKKHANKRLQRTRDSELFGSSKNLICEHDKRRSQGSFANIPNSKSKNQLQIPDGEYEINEADWKTQTYQKMFNLDNGFEPIIERPLDEAYGTASHKRTRRKVRNFNKFYDKEMNFMQGKYNFIAEEIGKKEEEVEKYQHIRDTMKFMSDGSRKILHNRLKTSIISKDPSKASQIAKALNTPVHERLFIDNENRKKRIEELKSFYHDFIQEGSFMNASASRRVLDLTETHPVVRGQLNTYRSVENISGSKLAGKPKISDSLRRTIAHQTGDKSSRQRLDLHSRRDKLPSSLVVSSEVSSKLYEDAMRRQSRKLQNIQRSRKRDKSASVQTNKESIKYLVKRFNQDFKEAMESQGANEYNINYFTTSEILKDMGFVNSRTSKETNEERIMFVDLWR